MYYRNKAHLKKYNEREVDRQRSFTKEKLQSKDQNDESMYELPKENEQNVTGSTCSERRLSRASTNPNYHPNLRKNFESSSHESNQGN